MLKREYEGQELCSVAMTLEIVGERWTWLIVRDAFLGLTRFAEFQASLGIARNVLADRLRPARRRGDLRARALQRAPDAVRVPADREGPRPVHRAERAAAVGRHVPDRRADASPAAAATTGRRSSPRSCPRARPCSASDEMELVPGPGFPPRRRQRGARRRSRSRRRTARRGRTCIACAAPRAALVLGHGAGGGVDAPDLVAVTEAANAAGFTVALVEQPYRVAGRRSPRAGGSARRGVDRRGRAAAREGAARAAARHRRPLVGRARRVPHRRGDRRGRRALPRLPAAAAAPHRPADAEPAARARRGHACRCS